MGRAKQKILAALQAKGYEVTGDDVWWEPIGGNLEMQGNVGGWMVSAKIPDAFGPIGLNVNEALRFIEQWVDPAT